MMVLLRRRDELVCQQVVELVSDYLEGARPDAREEFAELFRSWRAGGPDGSG